jgi:hypothetical protein
MPIHIDPASVASLNAVARSLEIEPVRAVRDAPNGFTWWIAPGMRQRVRVQAGPPLGTLWLRIETPVWRGADPARIEPLLDALRQHARGAAVVHAPGSGDVTLVTRVPLPGTRPERRAAALAGTGAIQAFLVAWAWGEANTRFADQASGWRDDLPHPELGMDVVPDPVFGYRDRVLRPQAATRGGAFADELLDATTAAIERTGLGLTPQLHPDGYKVTFAVDLGLTLGVLEVGFLDGPVDSRSLCVVLTVPGHLGDARAHACCHELLGRQLAPDAAAWTLGSWAPVPRRDGRPGLGLNHGLFVPLALAEADLGPDIAGAASRSVEVVRNWFAAGAPAPVAAVLRRDSSARLVA